MAVDPDWLADLFAEFGPVRLKRMFSGYGVYAGEHCVALAIRPGFCLRVDAAVREAFVAAGAAPFTYAKKSGAVTVQKWWLLPAELVDEPETFTQLARLSLEVARRLPPKRPSRRARAEG